MTWSSPADLKSQLMRLWERGDLMRDALSGQTRFPLRLTLRCPNSADLTERFVAVRAWVSELTLLPAVRLEWQEVRHRVQGVQRLPAAAWVDTVDEALRWIGKRAEWQRWCALADMTRRQCPALLPWLQRRPLQALALEAAWPRLLAVVDWRLRHPQPDIYLRQIDLPGVHTKFIESHRAVLSELLDLSLPGGPTDPQQTGIARFAVRYGFRDKPLRIRLRALDPDIRLLVGVDHPDMTLDAASFGRLAVDVKRVVITENETNFLALPPLPGTLGLFGAGYGWEALAQAHWLERCALHYWGDIDTHGFAILDQLRAHFGHAASLMMDRATLEAHRDFWGMEDQPYTRDLHRLTPDEQDLYNDLRDNRFGKQLRLEQEQLGFGWVRESLGRLVGA